MDILEQLEPAERLRLSQPHAIDQDHGSPIPLVELVPLSARKSFADTDVVTHRLSVVEQTDLVSLDLPVPQQSLSGVDKKGLPLLIALHLSSTWGDRCFEFAAYIFLIEAFKTTLLPASIFGFCTTGAAILFSGSIGRLVDSHTRLLTLRTFIVIQKLSTALAYALYIVTFFHKDLLAAASSGSNATGPVWAIFTGIMLSGVALKLATVGVQVSIERDWATTIGLAGTHQLMTINAWLRRTDLVCKLVAPLFVSAFTAGVSYRFAAVFLCGMSVCTTAIEIPLCGIVYHRFPALQRDEDRRRAGRPEPMLAIYINWKTWLDPRPTIKDWQEFAQYPAFFTSLSISRSYLKAARNWDDPFIAGMRALCTFTGLVGTVLLPFAERRVGLIRTGAWSIWLEVVTLVPTVLALYVGAPKTITHGPTYNNIMLFGGMAASRIGLWMFDLAQMQILQEALQDHPRRNALTGLQYSLSNTFDMLKYVLTIILSNPAQFRWAGLVSWASVLAGALLFLVYVRRVRGHVVHTEWAYQLLAQLRKKAE